MFPINWSALRQWLWPEAERDEGFHQDILSLSHRGLAALATIEIAVGCLAFAGMRWYGAAIVVAAGVCAAAAHRAMSVYSRARDVAVITAAVCTGVAAWQTGAGPSEDFGAGAAAAVMFGLLIVPIKPWQALAAGACAGVVGIAGPHPVLFSMMTAAAVALAAMLYHQRSENYAGFISMIQATQDLRSRLTLAETSATMVRMSAALAHELSSPIGSASSAISTLLAVSSRIADASPTEQRRLASLQADLGRSLQDSMARLKKIVNRIQRLTVLDEASTQRADVNQLIRDALNQVEPELHPGIRVEVQLEPLPEITCRPQQLINVFSNLLANSIQAIEGDGQIVVSSRHVDGSLQLTIQDNGRGIPAERLPYIFDPSFQASDGRISTGNWSLFTSRQYVKDHGGDMRIESREGAGTKVSLTLPC